MTPEELNAIESRANAATPGPWENEETAHETWREIVADNGVTAEVYLITDADFIAHSRTDIPALIAEVRRLQTDNDRAARYWL